MVLKFTKKTITRKIKQQRGKQTANWWRRKMRWARCVAIRNNVPFVNSIQFAIKYAITESDFVVFNRLHFGCYDVGILFASAVIFHSHPPCAFANFCFFFFVLLLYSSSRRMIVVVTEMLSNNTHIIVRKSSEIFFDSFAALSLSVLLFTFYSSERHRRRSLQLSLFTTKFGTSVFYFFVSVKSRSIFIYAIRCYGKNNKR